jgi:predicted AAA+ superfamily ATPase
MYKLRQISSKIHDLQRLYSVLLLTGPRQTGKTTLCRELFSAHQWVLLDEEAILSMAKAQPDLFLQNFPPPVIYDEVQRATNLFLSIKNNVDRTRQKSGARFVLTGSQPLALMASVSDSLAGRVGIVEILPMTHSEIYGNGEAQFTFQSFVGNEIPIGKKIQMGAPIQEVLFRGGFPDIGISELSPKWSDVATRFGNYVKTYLHRDLRDLKLVQDLLSFEKFLRRVALASATHQGPSAWANDIGKPRSTIVSWLGLLNASYLTFEIPAFSAKLGQRERKAPKYHLVDSGLMSHLLAYQTPDQILKSPMLRAVFETYGLVAFRAWAQRSNITPVFYHWRYDEREEVDLLFELSDGEIVAVEFKLTAKPNADDLAGTKRFRSVILNVAKAS